MHIKKYCRLDLCEFIDKHQELIPIQQIKHPLCKSHKK